MWTGRHSSLQSRGHPCTAQPEEKPNAAWAAAVDRSQGSSWTRRPEVGLKAEKRPQGGPEVDIPEGLSPEPECAGTSSPVQDRLQLAWGWDWALCSPWGLGSRGGPCPRSA